ncbi:hypothetical protein [Streptomyces capparidis]
MDQSSDEAAPRPAPAAEAPRCEDLGSEVWTGRATNRLQWLAAAAGAGCLALGIELAVGPSWTGSVLPVVMSAAGCIAAGLLVIAGTLAFVHVAVRVDREGLEVRCGHLGLPRRRFRWDEVAAVRLAKVTPRHWGGWGYRWRPERGTALVVRRGPGLVLELKSGLTFTLTVDDAESAVRAIQTCLHPPEAPGPR